MISEGRNINVTLIFSLERYQEVMDAYLAGLEAYAATDGADLSQGRQRGQLLHLPRRHRGRPAARRDRHARGARPARQGGRRPGQAGLPAVPPRRSPARGGRRWRPRGAASQRPLWASTSTKNPAYPDTLYVDELIGPDTVNTLPDATIEAFADHGTLARRVDADVDEAEAVWQRLAEVGVDMDDVADRLEREGVASFQKSFDELLAALEAKAAELGRRLTAPIERRADGRDVVERAPGGSSTSSTRRATGASRVELVGARSGC